MMPSLLGELSVSDDTFAESAVARQSTGSKTLRVICKGMFYLRQLIDRMLTSIARRKMHTLLCTIRF